MFGLDDAAVEGAEIVVTVLDWNRGKEELIGRANVKVCPQISKHSFRTAFVFSPPPQICRELHSQPHKFVVFKLGLTSTVTADARGKLRGRRSCRRSRNADVRLPGKGNSNSNGARPIHINITMI